MKLSRNLPARKNAGFIISLEFLLLMSLIVFPLLLGMVLLGRKLVTLYLTQLTLVEQPLSRPVVFDGSAANQGKPMGQVIGYDRLGAAQILYRDTTTGVTLASGAKVNTGIVMSVRPRRFTTVSRVYYDTPGCTGNAFVKTSSSLIGPWPNVGYFFQTQGWNYAVGRNNLLYRETPPLAGAGAGIAIASVWVSEDTRDASPAGTPSTACFELPDPFTATLSKFAGSVVTVSGAPTFELESGFQINVAGAANAAEFDGGPFTVTATGPNTFTYDSGVAYAPGLNPLPDTATITVSATVPNLVSAFCVSALGNVAGPGQCATTNFVPPYRIGFSTGIQ